MAWLHAGEFLLDMYIPTEAAPLPAPPPGIDPPVCIAFDAPQGLPTPGEHRRRADREARTPTNRLPASREALATEPLAFRQLIAAGIEIFWWLHRHDLATVAGLSPARGHLATACETYPRLVLERLGIARRDIPSKTKAELDYVNVVWARLQREDYRCPSVRRPTADQVDAMLCAVAAEAWARSPDPKRHAVGEAPRVDAVERVLYEGYIVTP